MTERLQVYKCNVCGNIVEVLHAGAGELVCCDEPMRLQAENTTDAATEKHVPVVEKADGGYAVKVGSVAHPMTAEHSIEWIELHAGGAVQRQFLSPDQGPEANFATSAEPSGARAYCNLHGLWKG
jgi:superoxide reductase